MSNSRKDYEVGFCRPPKATQFKVGQSGNIKGRPRGAQNLNTILAEELSRKVPVTLDGRPRRLSKGRVAVMQQVDKAVKGDSRSFAMVTRLQGEFLAASPAAHAADAPAELSPAQCEEVVRDFLSDLSSGEAL